MFTPKPLLPFIGLSFLLLFTIPAFSQGWIDDMYKEANEKFYCQGKPINPKIIDEFNGLFSDASPIIITVDLAAGNHSNKYFEDSTVSDTYILYGIDKDGIDQGSFYYQYLGKTANNIHVVKTSENGGGSGQFEFLLFFSFKIKKASLAGITQDDQLLMTLEGVAGLGDTHGAYGTGSDIKIVKNKVIITLTSRDQDGKEQKSQQEINF